MSAPGYAYGPPPTQLSTPGPAPGSAAGSMGVAATASGYVYGPPPGPPPMCLSTLGSVMGSSAGSTMGFATSAPGHFFGPSPMRLSKPGPAPGSPAASTTSTWGHGPMGHPLINSSAPRPARDIDRVNYGVNNERAGARFRTSTCVCTNAGDISQADDGIFDRARRGGILRIRLGLGKYRWFSGLTLAKTTCDDFISFLSDYKIIYLLETWTKKSSKTEIEGYKTLTHSYRKLVNRRAKRAGGGVIIYVKDEIHKGVKLINNELDCIVWLN